MRRAIPSLVCTSLAAMFWAAPLHAQAPSIWKGSSPITSTPTAVKPPAPFPVGLALPMRDVANLIDGVGQAIDEPAVYEAAIQSVEAIAGPRHPFEGYLHIRLAALLFRHGDRARALDHALEGESILRDQLYLDLRDLSSAEALRMARQRESALDLILTLATTEQTASGRARCWDAFIRARALVLDELASRGQAVASSHDTTLSRLAAALTEARERLADESFREPDPNGQTRQRVEHARASADSLERDLARRSQVFRERLKHSHAGLEEVLSAREPGEVLVSYAYYVEPPARALVVHSLSYRFLDRVEKAPRASVMAFVLRAGEFTPSALRLGRAVELDSLVERWRALVTQEAGTLAEEHGRDRETQRVGDLIRQRIWDPIAPSLAGAKRVLVVLDGALQLLNVGALPAPEDSDSFVLEHAPVLSYLSAERDLVRRLESRPDAGRLVALGGMRFRADSTGSRGRAASSPVRTSPCGELPRLRFPWLPASESEARDAAGLWCETRTASARACDARVLIGLEATKRRFIREGPGASVLHLSTHGFFLTCPESSTPTVSWRPSRTFDLAPPPVGTESPMLCSGLVFSDSGMQQAADDWAGAGLLTAEEVGALDLSAARIVVLSACETGVGVLEAREGLLGLRRAFAIAGAGGLVVSLWAVGDQPSRSLMRGLYDARFRRGAGLAAAANDASIRQLARLREQGLSTSPADWGGFVVVGVE